LYTDYKDIKNYFDEFAKGVLFPIVSYPSFSFNDLRLIITKDDTAIFNCKINIRNTILRSAVYEFIPGMEKHIGPGTELVDDIIISTSTN
jgi:hypothetical protein